MVMKLVEDEDGDYITAAGFAFDVYKGINESGQGVDYITTVTSVDEGAVAFGRSADFLPGVDYYVFESLTAGQASKYKFGDQNPDGYIIVTAIDAVWYDAEFATPFYNDLIKGMLYVQKFIETADGYVAGGEGFEFTVTIGNETYTATTDVNGKAVFGPSTAYKPGQPYDVYETPKDGYKFGADNADGKISVIAVEEDVTEFEYVAFYNDLQKWNVGIQKLIETADGNYVAGEGFVFELYDADGVLMDTKTTGADGKALFGPYTGISGDGYYFKEVLSANQAAVYKFAAVNADGTVAAVFAEEDEETTYAEFYNDLQKWTITVQKFVEGDGTLEGFVFELRDAEGNVIDTQTTGTDGKVVFGPSADILPGVEYYIYEILGADSIYKFGDANLDGYIMATAVEEDGEAVIEEFYNDLRKGMLYVQKFIETADGYVAATGFEFSVTVGDNTYTVISDVNGCAVFGPSVDFVPGTAYDVYEILGADSIYKFGADNADGKISVIAVEEDVIDFEYTPFYNDLKFGKLVVKKVVRAYEGVYNPVDEVYEPVDLSGEYADVDFNFTVTDSEGNIVAEFTLRMGDSFTLDELLPGVYTVTEDVDPNDWNVTYTVVGDNNVELVGLNGVVVDVFSNETTEVTATNELPVG